MSILVSTGIASCTLISEKVLDIGCGEGETIACMCNPAPWLLLQSCPGADEADPDNAIKDFLHIETIYALDISSHDLRRAVELTAPPPPPPPNGWQGHTRCEPLEVKLWEGGMESYNPEFVDMECIISTEVYVLYLLSIASTCSSFKSISRLVVDITVLNTCQKTSCQNLLQYF